MNATLIMAFILILIVVATVITKKLPFNFVLFIAPVLCALILGHSIEETSTFIVEQLASMMKSAGFMLLFAFLYFQMLTEAGVFDTIVSAITTKLGNKMNVIVIMVLTTLIGGFSILTGNFTPAYLITFPLMVPLYKKFDFDREAAFIIAQTAMSAMCFIPWGIGMAYTASSAGLDANKLAAASMPWGLCFIPAIIFQWVYFGIKHKRRVGTFQAVTTTVEAAAQQEENPNRRPKLFWVNFILFILCLVALGIFGIAPYFVFIFATVITAMLNYKDNFGEIFNKVGPMYLNILIMLLAINVYQAVFNNTGMVEALSNGLMQVCPSFLLRYLHVIMLLLCVVIIYVVPFQIFNALCVLDFGNDADVGIVLIEQVADVVHILCGAHKGSSDEVKAVLHAKDDVLAVLLAQIGHGQMHAGHIDTLFGLDLAAVQHGADDVGVGDLLNVQHDQAVVQHDGAAGLHVLGQILVSDGADLLGALHLAGGQGKGLAGFQHLHTVLELLQADLGALGVQQGGNGLAQLLTQRLQLCQTAAVLLVGTVGEVETGHVHAVCDQVAQDIALIGRRAQGADDLRFSHKIPPTFML